MSKNSLLVVKKATIFLFFFSLFGWPGQNDYLAVHNQPQPSNSRWLTFKLPRHDYPVNITGKPAPSATAQSVLVLDADSAVILYAKEPQKQLLPASTVKMMTALVALEHYRLDDILVVDGENGFGQDIGLVAGEQISVHNLLYALLVASANDAAEVLAQHYPGGESAFVARMNQKAKQLNLKQTTFVNPTGLDVDEQEKPLNKVAYSTALDLSRLARVAWQQPIFQRLVATPQITVTDVSGMIKHPLTNINALVGTLPGAKGIKTGWTDRAGECLVSLVERNDHRLLVVVLGAQDRFGETKRLVEWAFANYQWKPIADPGSEYT